MSSLTIFGIVGNIFYFYLSGCRQLSVHLSTVHDPALVNVLKMPCNSYMLLRSSIDCFLLKIYWAVLIIRVPRHTAILRYCIAYKISHLRCSLIMLRYFKHTETEMPSWGGLQHVFSFICNLCTFIQNIISK